jgi:hypothetical protein
MNEVVLIVAAILLLAGVLASKESFEEVRAKSVGQAA